MLISEDPEVRFALYLTSLGAREAGTPLADWEEEFVDQVVAGDLPLSRRQRGIAREILERHNPLCLHGEPATACGVCGNSS